MSDELVFYTNPMSRGRIVRWMLEEVGAPYQAEILGYAESMKAPAYLAINPMGKVPAIRHGETVVTEAAAICAYLADAFPAAGLAPPHGDRARGPYYRWLFFGAGPVEMVAMCKNMSFDTSGKEVQVGFGSMDLTLDALEMAVTANPYLAGDKFSAADVYTGSHIGWGMQFGFLERRPAFERYWERIGARPAAARARKIDDALMPAQPAPAS
ncbi:MAG TPA: glutathione S-transferase family protein [Caulobacteraceae bacterium]|jgi:glutathione S-transferase|nr:glutathione S-transferase family protein [Caulobacteraceae bacterium]